MEVYKEKVSSSLLLAGLLTRPPLGIGLAAREAELEALPRPGLHVSAVSRRASPHSWASSEVSALDPALPRQLDKRATRSVGFPAGADLTADLFLTGSKRWGDEIGN